jgi:diadenylate cyclase
MNRDLKNREGWSPLKEDADQFIDDLTRYIFEIKKDLAKIEANLNDTDCCILSNFEHLARLVTDIQTIASSYYLKSYLAPFTDEYIAISLAAHKLSEKRHGALIVVERTVPVAPHINNGIPIDAKISQPLLETIFYPGNPMHDGGTVIQNNSIISAGNILPLSNQSYQGRKLGTRHRAALGLSEQTDALTLVVSEETGRISFAFEGTLYVVKT